MAEERHKSLTNVAQAYRLATRLHSALPVTFSRQGFAFPALHYYLEVTRRCNLRCAMCQYIDWLSQTPAGEQKAGEITTEEWRGVIDQTGGFSVITFTGGEPWVRPDFLELLEYASARRRTHFISNGTLLTEERARRCVELAPARVGGKGFNFAGVSIEGPREVHDAIVRQDGAYERAVAGVTAMSAYRAKMGKKCPLIHVTTVIQGSNADFLSQMPALVAATGADVLNLTIETQFSALPGFGVRDPDELDTVEMKLPRIAPQRLQAALDATAEAAQQCDIELRLPRMPREELLQYYDGGLDLKKYTCRIGWHSVHVSARGDVCPCFIYRAGNVREQPLREIWNSPLMRVFRRRCRKGVFDACQGCCNLEFVGKEKSRRAGDGM